MTLTKLDEIAVWGCTQAQQYFEPIMTSSTPSDYSVVLRWMDSLRMIRQWNVNLDSGKIIFIFVCTEHFANINITVCFIIYNCQGELALSLLLRMFPPAVYKVGWKLLLYWPVSTVLDIYREILFILGINIFPGLSKYFWKCTRYHY